jgi:SAM-dependent methyltransferase
MKILPEVVSGKPSGPILVFAPERIILRHLTDLTSEPIYTTDLYRSDVDFPGEDIQNLSFRDGMFALLICNHVLEHVPDDQAALHECARILKGGGVAVFTVPGNFSRSSTWHFDSPDDNGHYRHYGLDIVDKMRLAFETVRAVDMGQVTPPNWKVRAGDYVFICVKGTSFEST